MDPVLITVAEYRTALAGLTDQARTARDELAAAHEATADAERTYRVTRAQAWAEVGEGTVPQRDARVQAATADARRARDLGRGRIDVAKAALRDCSDRRSSLDQVARWSVRVADLDRAGPNVAPLTRDGVAA